MQDSPVETQDCESHAYQAKHLAETWPAAEAAADSRSALKRTVLAASSGSLATGLFVKRAQSANRFQRWLLSTLYPNSGGFSRWRTKLEPQPDT
jgi:hypothetical protein